MKNMVVEQIISRGVIDKRVLRAMESVPRHLFVPEEEKIYAYEDTPLPIGYGQTISQPYIVAYMTEALALEAGMKVLEIGTGSGYQAAILSQIVQEVYSVERIPELAETAVKHLSENYKNVFIHQGDGYDGWQEHAPYNAIIITAALPCIPEPLLKQLDKKGRMIVPIGESGEIQFLMLVTFNGKEWISEKLLPVRFVPFISSRIQ